MMNWQVITKINRYEIFFKKSSNIHFKPQEIKSKRTVIWHNDKVENSLLLKINTNTLLFMSELLLPNYMFISNQKKNVLAFKFLSNKTWTLLYETLCLCEWVGSYKIFWHWWLFSISSTANEQDMRNASVNSYTHKKWAHFKEVIELEETEILKLRCATAKLKSIEWQIQEQMNGYKVLFWAA